QDIPGSAVDTPLEDFALPMKVDVAQHISAKDTGKVTLGAMYLDITTTKQPAGDSDDWSFVDRVELYVRSTKEDTKLAPAKVAEAVAPGAVTHLEFVPVDVNLLPYLAEGCELTVLANGHAPADEVSFDGLATFHVSPL